MKYFQNPDNRYRVVEYTPTLDNLKESYADMYRNFESDFDSLFNESMKEIGYTSVDELIKSNMDFIKVLYDIFPQRGFKTEYIGLQEIETGKIINRLYKGVYSFHPELGYAILQKEHEREFLDLGLVFAVVSLKTGKEYPLEFLHKPSGINGDLTFFGYTLGDRYYTFKIDEINDELVGFECLIGFEDLHKYFPDANHADTPEYGIAVAENGTPFFLDPDFILTAELDKSLDELTPEKLPSVS